MTNAPKSSKSKQAKAPTQSKPWAFWRLVLGVCLVCGVGFAGAANAAPKPPTGTKATSTKKPRAKIGRHTIYIFRDGSLIGLSIRYTYPYRMEMLINTAHKLQWIRCWVGQAHLIILPQGGVLLNQVQPAEKFSLTFNQQGRLEGVGKTKLLYDLNGRISLLGKTSFGYDPNGRLYKIGGITIEYRADRKVEKIGNIKMSYRSEGRIQTFGNLQFQYQADGKIAAIGKRKFGYHPLRGIMIKSSGLEPRVKLQVHWSTLDIYRILRQKK